MKPENPPAFPTHPGWSGAPGMTLRDWFAGQALAGMMACPTISGDYLLLAEHSYAAADAMLAERAKAGGSDEAE